MFGSDSKCKIGHVLEFVKGFSWLANIQVINLFIDRFWENIPNEWQDFFRDISLEQLNTLPQWTTQDDFPVGLPPTLASYIEQCRVFGVDKKDSNKLYSIPLSDKKGLNPKKIHEVERLGGLVDEVCQKSGCKVVVDLGSGLGYLGKNLCTKYPVLGLEMHKERAEKAKTVHEKKGLSGKVFTCKPFCLEGTQDSFDQLTRLIEHHTAAAKSVSCGADSKAQSSGVGDSPLMTASLSVTGITASLPETELRDESMQCQCTSIDCFEPSVSSKCQQTYPQSTKCQDSQDSKCVLQNNACQSTDNRLCAKCHTPVPRHDLNSVNVNEHSISNAVCLISLHSCADLTPNILRYFVRSNSVHSAVLVSCCHHKMSTSSYGSFVNFPMSTSWRNVMMSTEFTMNICAMRLAAQETSSRWHHQTAETHQLHLQHVAFRALLQVYLIQENLSLKKLCRHIGGEDVYSNFDAFLNAVCSRTNLIKTDTDRTNFKSAMQQLYLKFEPYFNLIEAFTCLQLMMQPVLEYIVHDDRLEFLREHGLVPKLTVVFDDCISPRNLAIVVNKLTVLT